ncbi:hypothetical protein [Nostoc cycadae]|uniref:DNA polymerase Y-family little finger domain-containing protein n=1 Tax=Nostoc cycadae WK-1 TaxID=1861711 RepID=A0A2H6LR68_9NOSO|nr:hypothetical protein [Nostoc cycadae]GBE95717.1 hypothetical protein NCWK1_5505 [Nostoc cycadae WK-1]
MAGSVWLRGSIEARVSCWRHMPPTRQANWGSVALKQALITRYEMLGRVRLRSCCAHHPSRTVRLVAPTADTRVVLEAAQAATAAMYRPNVAWKKAGVGLVDLSAEHIQQSDLFAPVRNPKSEALMKALD